MALYGIIINMALYGIIYRDMALCGLAWHYMALYDIV